MRTIIWKLMPIQPLVLLPVCTGIQAFFDFEELGGASGKMPRFDSLSPFEILFSSRVWTAADVTFYYNNGSGIAPPL